jgi:signal transduction histidine kinase
MGGFSEVLLEDHADRLDDEGKRLLGRVAAGAQRMASLIDALLGLSRLSRTEVARERVDLSELARTVLDELAGAEPSRSVETIVEDGLVVTGDPRLLRAVLENLLGNALKFTRGRDPARIELRRATHEGSPCYCVRDNGAGFNMEYLGRLFTPFQRLHKTGQFEGNGVGLATVERIIRRHGGRVWADGVPEQGASFYFTLPT